MDNTELKEMIEKDRQRRADYMARGKEALLKEVPGLEWDDKKASLVDFSDVNYFISNTEYYHIDYIYGPSLRKTDLGYTIEWAEKFGTDYQLIEYGRRLFYLEKPYMDGDYVSSDIHVTEFWKERGTRIKGKRRLRALHQSTKGLYFEISGKRVYVKWEAGQGA